MLLIGGSIISLAIFVKVFATALTAVFAYLAVCFTCHAVAMICDVVAGLGATFQSWRP